MQNSDHKLMQTIMKVAKIPHDYKIQIHAHHSQMFDIMRASISIETKLSRIANIIAENNLFRDKSPHHHTFICGCIANFVRKNNGAFATNMMSMPTIVDIGGGDGSFMAELGAELGIPLSNMTCVEHESSLKNDTDSSPCVTHVTSNAPVDDSDTQSFQYQSHKHVGIKYTHWNDDGVLTRPVANNSATIIVCMVSLHHMSDEFINTVLVPFINRVLRPGGHLLIKEHDACDAKSRETIMWEHYLYDAVSKVYTTPDTITQYTNQPRNVLNLKSGQDLDAIFDQYVPTDLFNNVFVPIKTHGATHKLPTNLYWRLFIKP
jgi:SAM-dependent methyltransferase